MTGFLKIDIRGEAVLAFFRGAGDKLHLSVRSAVDRLSIELQTLVKKKLSGEVLHNRTGTLRRSINRVIVDTPARIEAQVGTNVVYAAIHEYGFDGEVNVREHVRRLYAEGTEKLSGASHGGIRSWKRVQGQMRGETTVKAHSRHVKMPERSYLRSSLKEMGPQIAEGIRAAALGALR